MRVTPRLDCPEGLPIAAHLDDIRAALASHRVVVVAGETGSGKTTQLPKVAYALGRVGDPAATARVAHTQPRRIAARAVAERVAEEMGVTLGSTVGYRVRFDDRSSRDTAITVMTDGLLLAQVRRDRMLRRYDTIIVDEAHERSLSIDFLLGYLAWLLPRRPDLRVVITSATLDTERIARHFGDCLGQPAGVPVIEVSGRTFPVEVRYRPPGDDADEVQAICDAVDELCSAGPGDVLVFCSGEREVRDAVEALQATTAAEVLPLFGRLSASEQHRVFAPHDGRRIVVATNVAETSLTVPGVHYVVDTGTARISRYSSRLKVQRLPIEPISRASAQQRAGRCGRVADGICIRLYDEAEYDRRPDFTEPEILRTNLASVILQLATLGLGEIEDFPFIDAPDPRSVASAIALLEEVGALDPAGATIADRVTDIGRRLATIPLDPRLGRMVLAGADEGCLDDVIVIAAGLTIRDPRERPDDRAGLADASHARFEVATSDFLSLLTLWDHLQHAQGSLSSSAFRRLCREEFLHYLRVREWQDLVAQVRDAVGASAITGESRDPEAIHRALLAGLLSHLGRLEAKERGAREYLGARGARFALWPGSALAGAARKRGGSLPPWVMAAELVETSRLWGRMAARIDPAWAEPLAGSLARRSHSAPVWSERLGQAVCTERVTLYGVPIVEGRRVPYARVDPVVAREWFIRHALVLGEWRSRHEAIQRNQALLDEAREREERARRRDVAVDEAAVQRFYDERLPSSVAGARDFDHWWRRESRRQPTLLDLPEALVVDRALLPGEEDFPSSWPDIPGVDAVLPVSYRFDPEDPRDGVTVHVPVDLLPALPTDAFALQVPGLREDLLAALLRGLPKDIRRQVGPAPDAAARMTAGLRGPSPAPVRERISAALRESSGVVVAPADWSWDRVPAHLVPTIAVVDSTGREQAAGKDLERLRHSLGRQAAAAVAHAVPGVAGQAILDWPDLPAQLSVDSGRGHRVTAYPALLARDDGSVEVEIVATAAEQRRLSRQGAARLLCVRHPLPRGALELSGTERLTLSRSPQGSADAVIEECRESVALAIIDAAGGPPSDRAGFEARGRDFSAVQAEEVADRARRAVAVLDGWWAATSALEAIAAPALRAATDDVRAQLSGLVHPGFARGADSARLTDLARYLRAVVLRLEKLPGDPGRDLLRTETVHRVEDAYRELPAAAAASAQGREIRWGIEELRVSLWAQELGTRGKVSEARLMKSIAALAGG